MKLPTSFSMRDLKHHRWVKKFKDFTSSNAVTSFVAKTIATIVIWAVALIPFWIYLAIRWISDPAGFWQELAIVVICMVVIGWLQAILAFGGAVLTIAILIDDTI